MQWDCIRGSVPAPYAVTGNPRQGRTNEELHREADVAALSECATTAVEHPSDWGWLCSTVTLLEAGVDDL